MDRFEIYCVYVNCSSYRWHIDPEQINWDGTWTQTSVGWVCPRHTRQALASAEIMQSRAGGK